MSGNCFVKLFGNFEQDGGARAAPDRVRALRRLEAAQGEASRQLAASRAAESALERTMTPMHTRLRQLTVAGRGRTRAALELQRRLAPLVRELKQKRVDTAHNERVTRQLTDQLGKLQRSDLHAVASDALRQTTPFIARSTVADAQAFRDAAAAANATLDNADDAEQEIEGELDAQFKERDGVLDQRFDASADAASLGADAGALLGDLDTLLGGAGDDYAEPAAAAAAPPPSRAPEFVARSGRAPPRMPPVPAHEFGDQPPATGGAPTLLADWTLQQH